MLKDFFPIIMLTFIVSFLGNGFVSGLSGSLQRLRVPISPDAQRKLLVLLYFSIIIGLVRCASRPSPSSPHPDGAPHHIHNPTILKSPCTSQTPASYLIHSLQCHLATPSLRPQPRSLFAVLTIPSLMKEGADLVVKLQSDSVWVVILDKMRQGLGGGVMDKVEQLILMASSEDLQRAALAATQSNTLRTQVSRSAPLRRAQPPNAPYHPHPFATHNRPRRPHPQPRRRSSARRCTPC